MNVLSLFDGMSCGRLALDRAGVAVTNYYASEVDKYALQIAKKNYPDNINLGDVAQVSATDLPKIDLLIGGSPCQGFSFYGKRLNFDDPRSKLFFEYVRLLKECKPDFFLLENVRMKKECITVITDALGVEPILINSALVSAQNRQRLYWTNIPGIEQPKDSALLLGDILEGNKELKIGTYKKHIPARKKGNCTEIGHADLNGHDFLKRVYSPKGKSPALTAVCGGNQERKVVVDDVHWRKLTPLECERLQTVPDNYTEGVSNTQRYRMLGNGWTIDVIKHIFDNLYLLT